MAKRGARVVLAGLMSIVIVLFSLWSSMAVWFDGPSVRWLAGTLAGGYAAGGLLSFLLVRPYRRAVLVWLAGTGLVLGWWLSIPPRNDRRWIEDVARLPTAEISGDRLTIHNLRDFDYRSETDFTSRWETRTYDLGGVRGADLFLSYWGPRNIAHTIMSWEFVDGQHLTISIETRKEVGESYSALLGFFRQYELYYVVADERDVVRLRTNYRGETVYLYRLRSSPDLARRFLLDYLRSVNALVEHPRWYNAFTHNCTTTIRMHAENISAANTWNWRILANGYGDELLYMNLPLLSQSDPPLAQTRARNTESQRKIPRNSKIATESPRVTGNVRDFGFGRTAVRP